MNKDSINRLLHTLVPFMVMTMVQRLLLLIFGHIGFAGELAELFAFLPAVAAAIVLFRLKTYHIYKEDERSETAPLSVRNTLQCTLHLIVTVAVMIVMMYATAAFMNGMSFSSPQTAEVSLLSFISAIIIHPLTEEYLFRHLFYGELRLLNPIFGCMMQAVMFAIIHNSVDSMLYALVSGIALAVLYERSGRIWTAVAAHLVINLRSFLYLSVFSGRSDIIQPVDMVIVILGCIAFLAIGVMDSRRTAAYDEGGDNVGQSEDTDDD